LRIEHDDVPVTVHYDLLLFLLHVDVDLLGFRERFLGEGC